MNNDGLVNEQDVVDQLRFLNGERFEQMFDGRPVYWDVDADGDLTILDRLSIINKVNLPGVRTTTYTYTSGADGLPAGLPLRYTNPSGETYGTEYYPTSSIARGLVKRQFRIDGNTEINLQTYEYNTDLNPTSVADLYGRTTLYTYDRLDLVTETRGVSATGNAADRPLTQYQYTVMGYLSTITDPALQTTSLTRNVASRSVSVVANGSGSYPSRTYAATYDTMGNTVSETDPLGRVTTYEYNSMDWNNKINLPAVSGVSSSLEYQYNPAGYMTSAKDLLGAITTYEYSTAGDTLKVTKPNPNALTQPIVYLASYASPGVLSTTTDPLGLVTTYITDNFGNMAAVNYPRMIPLPRSAKETVSYDSSGRVLATTDIIGQFQLLTIDSIGRVTKAESMDPDRTGPAVRPTYTLSTPQLVGTNIVQNTTVPDGRVLTSRFDLRDRLQSVQQPRLNQTAGTITTGYQYDNLDRTISETSATGAVTQYGYNRFNELTTVTGADPISGQANLQYQTSLIYDAAGRLTQMQAPNGAISLYGYDALDRQTFINEPDPDGAGPLTATTSNFVYNLTARTVVRSGSDGDTQTSRFDILGRTTSQTNGDGGTTNYAYNVASQLTQLTDPVGNVTRWGYDQMGRATSEEQVGIGTRWYSYSIDGLLASYTNRVGEQIEYAYNLGGQVTQETWVASNSSPARTRSYEYNTLSRLTKISDASNNQVSWTYNTAGLVTNETTLIPLVGGTMSTAGSHLIDGGTSSSISTSIASSVNYGYDIFGRNVSTQLSVNGVLQYTDAMGYDLRNRMSSLVRTGSGNANENMWTTFQFNNLDQIVGSQRGSGSTAGSNLELIQTITRDQIGRPTQIAYTANNPGGTSPLDSYSMQYVSGSDRLDSQTTPAGTTTYSYTPGGQLSRAGTVNYAYDANGNATSRGGVSTIVGSFNRMMDDGLFTFAYDAEGRTTSRTNKQSGEIERYQWNQVSQLTQVNVSPNSSTPATSKSIRYGYDQVGRRSSIAQASSPLSAATSVDYLLSDGDQVAQILGTSGAVTSRFMYGSAVDSVLSEQTFGSGGATSAKWQLTDHLGSVRGVAQKQAGGNTSSINQVQYDAYGKITSQTNVGSQPRFGFAGRDIESVGGMTYNRNRYYSTSSGRFISQDPIGFNAGDENLYRYVGNSPTNARDPSGLFEDGPEGPKIVTLTKNEVQSAVDAEFKELIGELKSQAQKTASDFAQDRTEARRNAAIAKQILSDIKEEEKQRVSRGLLQDSRRREQAVVNLDASASMVIEPYDWYLTAQSIYNHPEDWTSYVGMVPFVPGALGKLIRAADDVPTSIVKEVDELTDTARGGPYGHLGDHPSVNSGKPFTQSQKQKILAENEARNGGELLDDLTGEALVRPQQHTRGVRPPDNEAQVDHVYPRCEGGPNTFSNAEVRARIENIKKGSKIE